MEEKINALDKLIEAVEAGNTPWLHGEVDIVTPAVGCGKARAYVYKAYEGSLDAALALHEAMLPGCYATLTSVGGATIFGNVSTHGTAWSELSDAEAVSPARAWLLAVLRAYRSVQS